MCFGDFSARSVMKTCESEIYLKSYSNRKRATFQNMSSVRHAFKTSYPCVPLDLLRRPVFAMPSRRNTRAHLRVSWCLSAWFAHPFMSTSTPSAPTRLCLPAPAPTFKLAGRFLLLHGARLQSSPMQEHQGPQTQAPTQTAESSKSIDPSNVAPGQQRSHQRTHLHTPQYSELRPAHMPIQCGRWKAFLVRGWLIFRPPFAQILERTQAGRIRVGWSRPPQPNLASGLQDRDRGRA